MYVKPIEVLHIELKSNKISYKNIYSIGLSKFKFIYDLNLIVVL